MTAKTVALVGTLDTKGEEFAFLRDWIESCGLRTLTVDTGVLGDPPFTPDVSRAEVAAAAHEDLAVLISRRDRGRSIQTMAVGAAATIRRLSNKAPSRALHRWAAPPAPRLPLPRCANSQ